MSEFDALAREWDNDKMHLDRSAAIATEMDKIIPKDKSLKALEYGAGTGLLSFLLRERFKEIVLMDSSKEMIKVCEEKIIFNQTSHIRPIWFDLEHSDFEGKFDIIYNQMVLHHVNDIDSILTKFNTMLNTDGVLIIADLFSEDGSFHGPDVKVHKGFDPDKLIEKLKKTGFSYGDYTTCFNIKRPEGPEYPVFFLSMYK